MKAFSNKTRMVHKEMTTTIRFDQHQNILKSF